MVTLDPVIGIPLGSFVCEAKLTEEPVLKGEDEEPVLSVENELPDPGAVARRLVRALLDVV